MSVLSFLSVILKNKVCTDLILNLVTTYMLNVAESSKQTYQPFLRLRMKWFKMAKDQSIID